MPDIRINFDFENAKAVNFINLTKEEKEKVRGWRNSEGVKRWMYSDHEISSREHGKFIEGLKTDNRNYYWLLKYGSDEYLGVIYLNKADFISRDAYLGIYKNPDCAIPKAGTALMKCLKRIAYGAAGLDILRLEVIEGNEGAIRFYKREGFVEEGRLRAPVIKNGKEYNVVVMGDRKGKVDEDKRR